MDETDMILVYFKRPTLSQLQFHMVISWQEWECSGTLPFLSNLTPKTQTPAFIFPPSPFRQDLDHSTMIPCPLLSPNTKKKKSMYLI